MNNTLTAVKNYLNAVAEMGSFKNNSRKETGLKKFLEQITARQIIQYQ